MARRRSLLRYPQVRTGCSHTIRAPRGRQTSAGTIGCGADDPRRGGDAVSWGRQVTHSLHRAGATTWEHLRPHVGAGVVATAYLVVVYLAGRR